MKRSQPFPFDAQAEAVMTAFGQDARERMRAEQSRIAGSGRVQSFNHGRAWQSHHSYDPDRVDEVQTLEHMVVVDTADVLLGRLGLIESAAAELTNGMAKGFAKMFYELLSDTCEEHGNVVQGGGTLGEQMLEALESIEFSVGRDGKVVLPEFRVGSDIARQLGTDPSVNSPKLDARAQEIMKLKSAQALEKEAARKAKFHREAE
nr:hypothetical protein [Pseudomonas sp.]